MLPLIVRADVQGSLEALIHSLKKIRSDKIEVDIVSRGIGEVSESDIQMAKTSGACIIGFHTRIESHAEELLKNINVPIRMPEIIYEAVDIVKELMIEKLGKVGKEELKGRAEIKAVFKASKSGKIAGVSVLEGVMTRNSLCRLIRDGEVIWKGKISSIRREKEEVKEVKKGFECGIIPENCRDFVEGDILEAYEIIYLTQAL